MLVHLMAVVLVMKWMIGIYFPGQERVPFPLLAINVILVNKAGLAK